MRNFSTKNFFETIRLEGATFYLPETLRILGVESGPVCDRVQVVVVGVVVFGVADGAVSVRVVAFASHSVDLESRPFFVSGQVPQLDHVLVAPRHRGASVSFRHGEN